MCVYPIQVAGSLVSIPTHERPLLCGFCAYTGTEWLKCFDYESAMVLYAHKSTREERYVTYDPSAGWVSTCYQPSASASFLH